MNYSGSEIPYENTNESTNEISTNIIYIPQSPSYILRLHLNYNWYIYIALFIMVICIFYINHIKQKLLYLLTEINKNNLEIKKDLENQKKDLENQKIEIKKDLENQKIEINDIKKKIK